MLKTRPGYFPELKRITMTFKMHFEAVSEDFITKSQIEVSEIFKHFEKREFGDGPLVCVCQDVFKISFFCAGSTRTYLKMQGTATDVGDTFISFTMKELI